MSITAGHQLAMIQDKLQVRLLRVLPKRQNSRRVTPSVEQEVHQDISKGLHLYEAALVLKVQVKVLQGTHAEDGLDRASKTSASMIADVLYGDFAYRLRGLQTDLTAEGHEVSDDVMRTLSDIIKDLEA